MTASETVNVRYLVEDVAASVDYYTRHFGFTVGISSPAFADVTRDNLRLLLSGPNSSAGHNRKGDPSVIHQGSEPGNSTTKFANLGGADDGHPAPDGWPAQGHRGDKGSQGDRLLSTARQLNRQSRRCKRKERPECDT